MALTKRKREKKQMTKILLIDSSPRRNASFSRKLSRAIVEKLKAKDPTSSVSTRDLTLRPMPHLEEAHLAAFFAPAEKHTAEDKRAIQYSDEAIAEILHADVIVLGVPMYNFGIPSVLKAWIDHLARAGKTFKYSEKGPEGLVKGKKLYLAIATGGVYSEGAMKAYDFTEPYLRTVFGFLGMTDVTTFRVEGVAVPGAQDAALEKAIGLIKI
jgi:FMN-dependent NADH-azoreductase